MDLGKFRETKALIIDTVSKLEGNQELLEDIDYGELEKQYFSYIEQLLSSDLSQIPFEEWEGLTIIGDHLDFSKTHANIDFSLIKGMDYISINLDGCNVRGLKYLDYDENTFSEEFKKNNPDFFPDETIPEEIRTKFYKKELQFVDLDVYPNLKKCLTIHSFGYRNISGSLVEAIGFDNALKMFEEYPSFILHITDENLFNNFRLNDFEFADKTYEEVKKYVFEQVLEHLKDGFMAIFPPLDTIPLEMKEGFPSFFIQDNELPKNIIDSYYSGSLTVWELRKYKDILHNKEIEIGTRRMSSERQKIEIIFGDVWQFINQVSDEYNDVVVEYLNDLSSDNIRSMETMNSEEVIRTSIENIGYVEDFSSLVSYSKYVPVEDLVYNEAILNFINICGLERLSKFNEENNYVLDINQTFYSDIEQTFLAFFSKFATLLPYDITINSQTELNDYLAKIVHEIRKSNDYKIQSFLNENKNKLSNIFPSEFLDYNLLNNLINDIGNNFYQEAMFKDIERAFDGDLKTLFELINQNPKFIGLFVNKNYIIGSSYKEGFSKLRESLGNEKFLQLGSWYGELMIQLLNYLSDDDIDNLILELKKENDFSSLMDNKVYTLISSKRTFDIRKLPTSFKKKYPELYLKDDAPLELQSKFYAVKTSNVDNRLNPSDIKKHPEWIPHLKHVDLEKVLREKIVYVYDSNRSEQISLYKGLLKVFNQDEVLKMFSEYGSIIDYMTYLVFNAGMDKQQFYDHILKQIYDVIIGRHITIDFNELPLEFKERYPDIFLDEKAPEELKNCFYSVSRNEPLLFDLLRKNKEWLTYLKNKNILFSLKKTSGFYSNGWDNFFRMYDADEVLRIGMKNPESVMKMVEYDKIDLLSKWYEKLKFIPHHVVMLEFPFEQSDKFVASGKKWSQLMRLDRYNLKDESKSALLKASMCFGVFDNDIDGFNKVIRLFSDIPRMITGVEMQELVNMLNNMDADKEEREKYVKLLNKAYRLDNNGNYIVRVNLQQDKELINTLRSKMEELGFDKILSPDSAHKLFGGFDMKYNPSFRDFLLDNLETILKSDDYVSYISSIQKSWEEIKVLNSNRILTLDLALDFVKSNKFTNIHVGNNNLADVIAQAGYNQQSFEILQEIYDYGKVRVFNSIPRITSNTEKYTYEVLRLDDPLALTIGILTDCCQELGNAAETSMEHSMVDKHGRIFVIRDLEGNIVAQSWMWRNGNVICFDNIEIPKKAFVRSEKNGVEREKFTDEIFYIYKQAAKELMSKDEEVYLQLYEAGKISKEQYDLLKIGKVTVGTGYNDIADSLKRNAELDVDVVARPPKFTPPVVLQHGLYLNDSEKQYVIAGKKDIINSNELPLTLYSDDYAIYDYTNFPQNEVISLQKLEHITYKDNYCANTRIEAEENVVSSIAWNYKLNPSNTKIMMNANFAIIYEVNDETIIIGDLLYNTMINDIDITDKVAMLIKLAFKQIAEKGKSFDITRLNKEQLELCKRAMSMEDELEKERGISNGTR